MRVASGDYAGEVMGACNEFSRTMRIPSVEFTREEAKAIRERCGYEESEFHLDADSTRAGVYCFKYDNASLNRMCAKGVTPEIFGETTLDVWTGKLPFAEESRFQKFKDDYEPYMMSTSNFFTAFVDAIPIGLAFSAPYWAPMFAGKVGPSLKGACKKVAEFFKRPPKDPPAGGSSGGDGPKSDIIILPGDQEYTMKRSTVSQALALAAFSVAIALLVLNDATGVGAADDVLIAPAVAGWMGAASAFFPEKP